MPPKYRLPKRMNRARPIKFGQDYFEGKRELFKPGFLSKSPAERSGILAKHYRKIGQTIRLLTNLNSRVQKAASFFKQRGGLSDFDKLNKACYDGKKVYASVFIEAQQIFSDSYTKNLGYGGSVRARGVYIDAYPAYHSDMHALVHEGLKLTKNLEGLENDLHEAGH